MALIGYARVSTYEQHLDLQLRALKEKGCIRIFTDKTTGVKDTRKGLTDAIDYAREGDALVVWKLDRAGRSVQHLIALIKKLQEQGIGFVSLTDTIDTTTAAGRLQFHMVASFAEFEHDIIVERTLAGLEAARARGRIGGRHPLQIDTRVVKRAQELYTKREMSVPEIMKIAGIRSRYAFYKYVVDPIKQEGKKQKGEQ